MQDDDFIFVLGNISVIHYRMNMCPFDCDGCGEPLDQPYKLPCLQHYVGPCCREKMFSEDMASECPVTSCRARVSPEFEWNIDKAALINRYTFCYCKLSFL